MEKTWLAVSRSERTSLVEYNELRVWDSVVNIRNRIEQCPVDQGNGGNEVPVQRWGEKQ